MEIKNLVVKVGTSTITHETGYINLQRIERLARVLSDIKNRGINVVLVSSGAIGVGMGKLGITSRPSETRTKQAMAAVGQVELMNIYSRMFADYGVSVSQVLLTKAVVESEELKTNAQNTFGVLMDLGVVPIVNENDAISTYEIEFGDNDTLSAYVAQLVQADLLVILSDIEGLYDSDPRTDINARLIGRVEKITPEIRAIAGGSGSKVGTGGMHTKLDAVEFAAGYGIDTVIANGASPSILYDIIEGKPRGTFFSAKGDKTHV